jgi:hypothetical protein
MVRYVDGVMRTFDNCDVVFSEENLGQVRGEIKDHEPADVVRGGRSAVQCKSTTTVLPGPVMSP